MSTSPFQTPSPLQPTALLDSAQDSLINTSASAPTRETIHRAISTAYYAVFHAINASNADITHGGPTNPTTAQARTSTYRQMRHNSAASRLNNHFFSLSPNARLLANSFIALKTAREAADYDPNRILTAGHANYWIQEARSGLNALQSMSVADRQTISNITLTGPT